MVGGVPSVSPPTIRQHSIASTCYPAGGMPLAFTQEDFLVSVYFLLADVQQEKLKYPNVSRYGQ